MSKGPLKRNFPFSKDGHVPRFACQTVQITLLARIGKQSVAHVQSNKMGSYSCVGPKFELRQSSWNERASQCGLRIKGIGLEEQADNEV
jgi:hypothetical protein